jgi:hypothetical protein
MLVRLIKEPPSHQCGRRCPAADMVGGSRHHHPGRRGLGNLHALRDQSPNPIVSPPFTPVVPSVL